MGLSLHERIAESVWRAMGWACDEKSNTVINSLKNVYRWRSTRWWHSLQIEMMERDLIIIQDGSASGREGGVAQSWECVG